MNSSRQGTPEHREEIGAILLQDRPEIMEEWESRIVQVVAKAEPEHRKEMRNHLPLYIDALGREFSNDIDQDESSKRLAEDHGRQRFQIGWDIDEILRDYRVLQDVIIDHLIQKIDVLTPRDVQSMARTMDTAILQAVTRYRDFQEATVKAAREEAHGIFDEAPHGAAYLDMTGRLTRVNSSFAQQLGYQPGELVGTTVFELTNSDDLRVERSRLQSVFDGERVSYTMEKRLVDRRDEDVWVKWAVAKHSGGEAADDYLVVTAYDISRRKRLGEELDVAGREVYAAKNARRTFIRSVGHELRTPLNAIIGMTKLAREEKLPRKAQDYLAASEESALVLLRLVNQILAFANSDDSQPQRKPFCLGACMDTVCERLHHRLEDSKIEAICNLDKGLPASVLGDEDMLCDILFHLIDNAIKFTEDGVVTVNADVVSKSRQEVRVEFQVRDTGIGIEDEERVAVFHPFHMVDTSNTRSLAGVGLGLSISNALVEQLGGRLTVATEVGEGSTFSFSLTFPLVPPESSPVPVTSEQAIETGDIPDVIKVLVAEDVTANQNLVLNALGGARYDVTVASDGLTVVDEVRKDRYDVVLMDLQMPKLDGIEATHRIRSMNSATSTTPIVAVTAMVLPEDRKKCADAGMNDYLAKPVDVAELRAVVERWAVQARSRASTSSFSTHAANVGNEVMEMTSALDRLRGDRKMFCHLAGFYVDDYPTMLASLAIGIEDRNAVASRRAAHSLKGLVATFSAHSCSADIDAIHADVKEDNFTAAKEKLISLRQSLLDLEAALRHECGDLR